MHNVPASSVRRRLTGLLLALLLVFFVWTFVRPTLLPDVRVSLHNSASSATLPITVKAGGVVRSVGILNPGQRTTVRLVPRQDSSIVVRVGARSTDLLEYVTRGRADRVAVNIDGETVTRTQAP